MKIQTNTIVSSIIGFLLGALFTILIIEVFPISTTTSKYEKEVTIVDNGIADSVDKLYDSVVVITSSLNGNLIGSGTGFIYKQENDEVYIITNNHVVSGGDSFEAIFSDGEEVEAILMGGDIFADIAVIKLNTNKEVAVAKMGSSESLRLGDTVFTVGAPVTTEYSGTVTRGIISGLDRLVSLSIGSTSNDWIMKVIQTDAAINPGNSGGPLANVNGEVIGVNTLKLVDEDIEGIGFSIPIEDVMKSVEYLEEGRVIVRPYFGVSLYNVDETYQLKALGINLDSSITKGAVIGSVIENSTAFELGITMGTVITEVNGVEVDNKAEFRYQLYQHSVGDEIEFEFIQDGKTYKKSIVLKSENE